MKKLASLPLKDIRTDGGTQCRVLTPEMLEERAGEYALAIQAGEDLCAVNPPVVFQDRKTYWLADGFIRLRAHELAGFKHMLVEVRQGTQRDAILCACGANSKHGLTRTPADKRNAVRMLLEDEEWSKWNNAEIARACCVGETLVRMVRKELSPRSAEIRKVTRGGTTYEMNTAAIGSGQQQAAATALDDEEDLEHLADSLPPHLAAQFAAMSPQQRADLLRLAREEGARQERTRPKLSPKEQIRAELARARLRLDKAITLAGKHWPKAVPWMMRLRKELDRGPVTAP